MLLVASEEDYGEKKDKKSKEDNKGKKGKSKDGEPEKNKNLLKKEKLVLQGKLITLAVADQHSRSVHADPHCHVF